MRNDKYFVQGMVTIFTEKTCLITYYCKEEEY